jgi:hypothetical protein
VVLLPRGVVTVGVFAMAARGAFAGGALRMLDLAEWMPAMMCFFLVNVPDDTGISLDLQIRRYGVM